MNRTHTRQTTPQTDRHRKAIAVISQTLLPVMLFAGCVAVAGAQTQPRLTDGATPLTPSARRATSDSAAAPLQQSLTQATQVTHEAPRLTLTTDARVGDVTRQLLAAQANGSIAGPPLPMLGATATAAYQRYLDSFSHKIPEFFQARVKPESQSGAGGMAQ